MIQNKSKYEIACEECLSEMFKRVGEKYPNEKLTSKSEWYKERSWTEEEQDNFGLWMKKFLKSRFGWSSKQIEWETGMFLLNWGWTTVQKNKPKSKKRNNKQNGVNKNENFSS